MAEVKFARAQKMQWKNENEKIKRVIHALKKEERYGRYLHCGVGSNPTGPISG